MKCYNCEEEVNPTLIYCSNCGLPLDVDEEDIQADVLEKEAERVQFRAMEQAKGLLVLSLFLFGSIIATRWVLLREQHVDHTPAYRVPYQLLAEEGLDPPATLDIETLPFAVPGR